MAGRGRSKKRSKGNRRRKPIIAKDTPLHTATFNQNLELMRELLDSKADIEAKNIDGNTPLHTACWKNIDAVKLLLDYGANIEAENKYGSTPIHIAVRSGDPNIVKLLLDYGANVNVRNTNDYTPLEIVLNLYYTPETLKLLLDAGADITPFALNLAKYRDEEVYDLVKKAYLHQQLLPLLSASARGEVFDERMYDRRLWRSIGRYV